MDSGVRQNDDIRAGTTLGRRLRESVKTKAWRESLEQNLWVDACLDSAATAVELRMQYEMMRGVLKDLEMTK